MKVLLDTSVLVAAMVEAHPGHQRALPWLQRVKRRELTAIVAAHSLAELYAVLTSLPIQPRLSPLLVERLIRENVLSAVTVVALSAQDHQALLEHIAREGIAGGATYDAVIAHVAWKERVDQLVTLNKDDFRRLYPPLAERIITP